MGLVTEIQRFCVHDGPGIRTTVFFKGCNLRCRWCHNPETLAPSPELQLSPDRCIACGQCIETCPSHAATPGRINRDLCLRCGDCTRICYAGARILVGRELSPNQVLAEVLEDRPFYANSGGGLTLSGGEPLFQPDFALQILRLCKAQGIHTAIESNLDWPWQRIEPLLPFTDLVMFDLKLMDDSLHRRWTGGSNQHVLQNIRNLAEARIPLIARTPVIAGINDSPSEIGAIADFLRDLPTLMYYELLPYHPLGQDKYQGLGMEPPTDLARPDPQTLQHLIAEARRRGIEVRGPKEA